MHKTYNLKLDDGELHLIDIKCKNKTRKEVLTYEEGNILKIAETVLRQCREKK